MKMICVARENKNNQKLTEAKSFHLFEFDTDLFPKEKLSAALTYLKYSFNIKEASNSPLSGVTELWYLLHYDVFRTNCSINYELVNIIGRSSMMHLISLWKRNLRGYEEIYASGIDKIYNYVSSMPLE
jgi:hypothetical protein